MSDENLEIEKRFTLNWLIQGAAQHAGMTFHHLVRDELKALEPKLLRLYDQFALIALLHHWRGQATMILGWPPRFWRQAAKNPNHPFFGHQLLSKYGGMLSEAGRRQALERSKGKGVTRLPVVFSFQVAFMILRLRQLELPHRRRLIQLAKEVTSAVWGIAPERLDGELADRILATGKMFPTRSFRGALLRVCIVGYGGVERRGNGLRVYAIGTNWQLLAKELVKGTAELICLHGLNQLSEETYQRVIAATDRLEYEPWMLQSGGELWRRLLAATPSDRPIARVLMDLARMPAKRLESVVARVIEDPERAQEHLAMMDEGIGG